MAVIEKPRPVEKPKEYQPEYCHVWEFDSRIALCGKNDRLGPHCGDYNGERHCDVCGCDVCPVCIRIADIRDSIEGG